MKNRKEIIEERLLRDNIRKIIKKNLSKLEEKHFLQEQNLRNSIRNIILEKVAVPDKVPHPITGINVLEDLLKKIIPVMLQDYSRMTTNPEQKRDYRIYIYNGLKNLLRTGKVGKGSSKKKLDEQEINVKLPEPDPNDMIDIGLEDPEEEEQDENTKLVTQGLDDSEMDKTGRNIASDTMSKISTATLDAYDLLDSPVDTEAFEKYLLTNVLLHLDKKDDEVGGPGSGLEDPTTPEYQEAAGAAPPPPEELAEGFLYLDL